jgi:hypothetical protein
VASQLQAGTEEKRHYLDQSSMSRASSREELNPMTLCEVEQWNAKLQVANPGSF